MRNARNLIRDFAEGFRRIFRIEKTEIGAAVSKVQTRFDGVLKGRGCVTEALRHVLHMTVTYWRSGYSPYRNLPALVSTMPYGAVRVEKVLDVKFEGETVRIDGKAFVNCLLIDCVVEYSGSPFMLVDTELRGCKYVFFGAARGTVHLLQSVGMMPFEPSEWGEFPTTVQ